MNIQRELSCCIAVILLVTLRETVGSVVNVPRDNNMELLILHNNDMHARFEQTSQFSSSCSEEDQERNLCYGGFARVADRVKDARDKAADGTGPPVLYLNAGDTYTGTVWFTLYKWKIAADFLNLLRPDAVSLGNHEFDNGVEGLSPFIRNLSCPVLCANIDYEKEPQLKADNFKKSTVIIRNGRKIGIIGYLTPETKFLVSPNNVEYSDEIEAIQMEVDNLLKEGVNILIALGHSGFQIDKKIAEQVEGIDLVIGGHSNTFLWNGHTPDIELPVGPYPTIVKQKSGKKVPVVQAFAYTKYLGKLHLTINPEGEIVKYDGQPILLDGKINRDPEVLKLLSTYRPKVVEYVETVVGSSKVLLNGSTETCRQMECNMGNLITDAMIDAYTRLFPPPKEGWTDAPIAIIQGGGIRGSIEDGNITRADILSTLPFENEIVSANIKGDILKSVLEWSVGTYKEVSGGFLHYSGIRIVYNLSEPIGHRVVSAVVRCGHCSVPRYTEISDDTVYKVIMPDFLLNGGDRYTMLQDGATLAENFNKTDMEVVEEYISRKSPIYPELQERIVLYGEDKSSGSIVKSEILGLILCLNLYVSLVL